MDWYNGPDKSDKPLIDGFNGRVLPNPENVRDLNALAPQLQPGPNPLNPDAILPHAAAATAGEIPQPDPKEESLLRRLLGEQIRPPVNTELDSNHWANLSKDGGSPRSGNTTPIQLTDNSNSIIG